jgi:hypothetical protein
MINRPPTQIELKLEDDLIDYTDTIEDRKIQSKIANNNQSPYENFKSIQNFDQYSNSSSFSPFSNNDIIKQNINSKFTPDRFPRTTIYKDDVPMK